VARALGTLVAVLCVARLILETAGHAGGSFASFGPISFVVLVGALGVLSAMSGLSSLHPGRDALAVEKLVPRRRRGLGQVRT
jgi:hypothetical protein